MESHPSRTEDGPPCRPMLRQKLLVGPLVIFSCKGSFDCVVASLREPTTSLRMTRCVQKRFISCWLSQGSSGTRESSAPRPLRQSRVFNLRCHPERSTRIRFMNPHAQSKDPCTSARASAVSGSSPEIAGKLECREIPSGTRSWNPTVQKTKWTPG